MPTTLSHPGTYIGEASGDHAITGVPTSIGLFVGWAARGPTDRASRLASFADFERAYGGLDARSLLGFSVKHFFDNGGTDLYVLRVVHGDATSSSATAGSLTIEASSPGAWANACQVRITRSAGDPARFGLEVSLDSSLVERFADLSLLSDDPCFIEDIVNKRSGFVVAKAHDTTLPADDTVIALGNDRAGADGTVLAPGDPAFHAAVLASFGAGTVTDHIDLFNIVCVPGLTDDATIGKLQEHCKARRAFLLVDSVEGTQAADMPATLAGLTGDSANNAALYYPWVEAPDPLQPGRQRVFPPCGFVAGIYARSDADRGVWKAPAGTGATINGASAPAVAMTDEDGDLLNQYGINCLRRFPGHGTLVWGARTLHGDSRRGSEWKYVPTRRLALFLEESLSRGTQWAVFERNDESLWAKIRSSVGAFLQGLFRQGAFQGNSARDAYYVSCGPDTTTQADINSGIVNIDVGFAPVRPAEFMFLRVQQRTGRP
jgi:hypothetical protein